MPVDLDELEEIANWMAMLRNMRDASNIRSAIAELAELRSRPAPARWTREKPTEPGDYPMRRTEVIRIHESGLHSYPRYLQEDAVEYGIPESLEPEAEKED
jgi:hypothetical protein